MVVSHGNTIVFCRFAIRFSSHLSDATPTALEYVCNRMRCTSRRPFEYDAEINIITIHFNVECNVERIPEMMVREYRGIAGIHTQRAAKRNIYCKFEITHWESYLWNFISPTHERQRTSADTVMAALWLCSIQSNQNAIKSKSHIWVSARDE